MSELLVDVAQRLKRHEERHARLQAEADAQKARSRAYHGADVWCHDRACPCKPPPKQFEGYVTGLHGVEQWQADHREWCARVMRDAAGRMEALAVRRRWWQR